MPPEPRPHLGLPFSRRSLLKVGAGLAAASTLPAVAACTSDGGTDGNTVRLAMQQTWYKPIQTQLDQFTEDSGIKIVQVPIGVASGVELIQQFTPGFVSGQPAADVLVLSDEATPTFASAGWLEPMTSIATDDFWSDFAPSVKAYADVWCSADDVLYRIPTQYTQCLFVVRGDVLETLRADVPKTWDDLLDLGDKAKGKGMYAFADAYAKPALAAVGAQWLTLQAKGDVFSFDAGTKRAFEFAGTMIEQGFTPKDSIGWNYDQSNAAYLGDQLVSMRQWDYFLGIATSAKDWYDADKVVTALPPAGDGGESATYNGGWGVTVAAASPNKDAAMQLAKFLTSKENAPGLAADPASSFQVLRNSTLAAHPDRLDLQTIKKYDDAGVLKSRPFHPSINEANSVVDDMFSAYLAGQLSVDDAMSSGEVQLTQL